MPDNAPAPSPLRPMTSADAGPRARLSWRTIRDVALPLGDLLVGRYSDNDAPKHAARWRVTLRVGVMPRPNRGHAAHATPNQEPIPVGEEVPAGSLLIPFLCFEACLHRHVRRDVLLAAYERFVSSGRVDVSLQDLWTYKEDALARAVPEPDQAVTWAKLASGEKAAAYEALLRDPKAARLMRRRLLQRDPFALLSSALHLARAGMAAQADQPAATAAVAAFASVFAEAQRRGAPDALPFPDDDVDLLHQFPGRRYGPQSQRSHKRFVTLAKHGDAPPRLTPSALRERDQQLVDALKSWRAKTRRPKGKPWAIADIEVAHALFEPAERVLSEDTLLPWAVSVAKRSPTIQALKALALASPFLRWQPSPWFRVVGPGPLHRVRLHGTTDAQLDTIAKLYAQGAPWAADDRQDAVVAFVKGGPREQAAKALGLTPQLGVDLSVQTF